MGLTILVKYDLKGSQLSTMKTWLMCRKRELSMSQTFKSVSLVSIMLLSVFSGMVVATDYAEANTVAQTYVHLHTMLATSQ